ncbi:MAG: DUF429 domain-containing protein [Planctomycetes bacterium]|nr:DUF429 domain-containing protein [Planctomycetota bacterium]
MIIIAGVDGCKSGWLCIKKNLDTGLVSSEVFGNAQSLIQQEPRPLVVAVDIPIGLTDVGQRQCDIEARRLIGERRSSVFRAPIRPALQASSRKQADIIQRSIEGKGVAAQAFAIYRKVLEFDTILSNDPSMQKLVKEVHPEVCFWACNNNRAMPHNKKKTEGRAERHRLVSQYVGDKAIEKVRSKYLVKEVAHDDIYDAFVALWTAERIYSGKAGLIPDPSPKDRNGLNMEMWY